MEPLKHLPILAVQSSQEVEKPVSNNQKAKQMGSWLLKKMMFLGECIGKLSLKTISYTTSNSFHPEHTIAVYQDAIQQLTGNEQAASVCHDLAQRVSKKLSAEIHQKFGSNGTPLEQKVECELLSALFTLAGSTVQFFPSSEKGKNPIAFQLRMLAVLFGKMGLETEDIETLNLLERSLEDKECNTEEWKKKVREFLEKILLKRPAAPENDEAAPANDKAPAEKPKLPENETIQKILIEVIPEVLGCLYSTVKAKNAPRGYKALTSLPVTQQISYALQSAFRHIWSHLPAYREQYKETEKRIVDATKKVVEPRLPTIKKVTEPVGKYAAFIIPKVLPYLNADLINYLNSTEDKGQAGKMLPSLCLHLLAVQLEKQTCGENPDGADHQFWNTVKVESMQLLLENMDLFHMKDKLQQYTDRLFALEGGSRALFWCSDVAKNVIASLRESLADPNAKATIGEILATQAKQNQIALDDRVQEVIVEGLQWLAQGDAKEVEHIWSLLQLHTASTLLYFENRVLDVAPQITQDKQFFLKASVNMMDAVSKIKQEGGPVQDPKQIAEKFLKALFPHGEKDLPVGASLKPAIWSILQEQIVPMAVEKMADQINQPENRNLLLLRFIQAWKKNVDSHAEDYSTLAPEKVKERLKKEFTEILEKEIKATFHGYQVKVKENAQAIVDKCLGSYAPSVKKAIGFLVELLMLGMISAAISKYLVDPLMYPFYAATNYGLRKYALFKSDQWVEELSQVKDKALGYALVSSFVDMLQVEYPSFEGESEEQIQKAVKRFLESLGQLSKGKPHLPSSNKLNELAAKRLQGTKE